MSRPARILVLRQLGLGDFCAGVAALRALRRGYPAARIHLAAPAALAPLVALSGTVDELLAGPELSPVPWRGPPPALAVDLHGCGPRSRNLLVASGAARLVGYTAHTWPVGVHESDRWCRLLRDRLGLAADPADLDLARPAVSNPRPGAVVVHPGAAYPSRRWPAGRFAEVAAGLAADGHRVVVSGGPGERGVAAAVAARAGLPAAAVLAGRTDLAGLAALVARARLLVCGDTGVAHLATAYRTPSVLLFGPTPPAEWGPHPGRKGPHTVLWHGPHRGDPWGEATDPALARIGVAEVLAAARRLLPPVPGERRRVSPTCEADKEA